MSLRSMYCKDFAKSMFKCDEAERGQFQIVGKNCVISLEGTELEPILDIWLIPKNKLSEGFTSRKLTAMLDCWVGDLGARWVRLDGEAYVKTKNLQTIVENRVLLGIKKRPEVSDATMAQRVLSLKLARESAG